MQADGKNTAAACRAAAKPLPPARFPASFAILPRCAAGLLFLCGLPLARAEGERVALPPAAALREAALESLLGEHADLAALERSSRQAREAGVSEQAILEARFLFHVDRNEDAAIAAMAPQLMERRAAFQREDSAIFASEDDWLAVIEYAQALAARDKGDLAAFKKHITEAFWLSPGQAAAFAPHIERVRTEQRNARIRVDLTRRLPLLLEEKTVTPAALLEGRKALVVHFWSPWSQACENFRDDFALSAAAMEKAGFAVVSILAEDSAEARADAAEQLRGLAPLPPGAWLADAGRPSLAGLLQPRDLPSMAVISDGGRVLFQGHPADPALWKTLTALEPALRRPAAPE